MSRNAQRSSLIDIIRDRQYRCGVEVGVWKGVFAEFILRQTDVDKIFLVDSWAMEDNDIQLTPATRYVHELGQTPELFQAAYQEVVERMDVFGERVTIIRCRSPEAAEQFVDGSLDFVYLDAIHYYEWFKRDLEAWSPKVRPGGIMAGDDFGEFFPDVERTVKEMFTEVYACGPTWLVNR